MSVVNLDKKRLKKLLGGYDALEKTLIILLVIIPFAVVIFFAASCFWAWLIMLCAGAASWHWSFWHALLPWGFVAALVFGAISGGGSK